MFVNSADLKIVSSKSNLIDSVWKWNTLVSTSYISVLSVSLSIISCEIMTRSQSRSLKYISYWAGTVHMSFRLYKSQIIIYIFYLYWFMAFKVHFKLYNDRHQPIMYPVRWHITTTPLSTKNVAVRLYSSWI